MPAVDDVAIVDFSGKITLGEGSATLRQTCGNWSARGSAKSC